MQLPDDRDPEDDHFDDHDHDDPASQNASSWRPNMNFRSHESAHTGYFNQNNAYVNENRHLVQSGGYHNEDSSLHLQIRQQQQEDERRRRSQFPGGSFGFTSTPEYVAPQSRPAPALRGSSVGSLPTSRTFPGGFPGTAASAHSAWPAQTYPAPTPSNASGWGQSVTAGTGLPGVVSGRVMPQPASASRSMYASAEVSGPSMAARSSFAFQPQSHMRPPAPPGPIARPTPGQISPPTGGSPPHVVEAPQQRRQSGRDEFDGPHQLLPKPADAHIEVTESQLIPLRTSLLADEQDHILTRVNDRLSQCAFDFVARYQFPIPIEEDKRLVCAPGDREWTQWCALLRRLTTKRRIPQRVLWHGQIKQLVTVLESSMEMRHAAMHQSRPLKDDRNILQLISAGLQVAKMLKDPDAMVDLNELYENTEMVIHARRGIS